MRESTLALLLNVQTQKSFSHVTIELQLLRPEA